MVLGTKKMLLWLGGDGSFKPTSHGHAAAPNKKLMLSLARFMTIVLVDEHGTTKSSCCCMEKAMERKVGGYRRRATVVQCPRCKTMLSRDFNAAVNIVEAFNYTNANHTNQNQFWGTTHSTE